LVTTATYPGQQLGLPEAGRGAVAGMGRRVGAIFIDWFLSMFVVLALIRPHAQQDVGYLTLAVFALQDFVLTATIGLTVGKRLLGIRVARLDGKLIGPIWGLVRTVLLLTVIAPLITDQNLRGLHDRASNTVVVRIS
jgi:uncharacterized RDD family membrane protein YckC